MRLSPAPKKSSILRILIRIFLILLCVLVFSTALLPSLLSSSWGKEKLTSLINQSIPGKVKIEDLSIGWFGPQSVHGFTFFDEQNIPLVFFESASSSTSLFSLITQNLTSGAFEFKKLNATIIGDSEGNTNLMKALDKHCCDLTSAEEIAPIIISLNNAEGYVNFSKSGPVTFKFQGDTEQNKIKGKFTVNAEMIGISFEELMDHDHDLPSIFLTRPNAELNLNADITNFPVELIDQMIALKSPQFTGLLTEILGKELNLKIDQTGRSEGITFSLQANSPNLSANGDFLLNKELSLVKPSLINLTLSTFAAEKLMELFKVKTFWRLKTSAKTTLSIISFHFPLSAFDSSIPLEINALGLKGYLDIDQTDLYDANKLISLDKLHVDIATEVNSPTAAITVDSQITQNEKPIKINFNLSLPKNTLLDFSKISLNKIDLQGDIKGAHLFIFDKLAETPFLLSSFLGNNADFSFSLQMHDDKPLAAIQFKSEQLEIPHLAVWIDKHLTLQQPAQIIFKINQRLISQLFPEMDSQLQGPATAQLALNKFSMPIAHLSSSLKIMHQLDLDAQLKITSVRLANIPIAGGISLNDFSVRLSANPKTRPELTTSFSLQPDSSSILSDIVGKKASFKSSASLGIGLDGKVTANVFNLQVLSDLARLELSGEMHEGNRLILNSPAMLSYTFTSAGLQMMGVATDAYLFKHGAPLEMTVDSSHIPLSLEDLSLLKLSGKLKINDFQLLPKTSANHFLAVVDNLSANWSIDAAQKLISIDFTGITRLGENQAAGKVYGFLTLTNWMKNNGFDLSKALLNLNANANKLPTELIGALSGQKDLVPLLGNAIDLSFEANASLANTEEGTLSIDINSENVSGSIGLNLGEVIRLNNNRKTEFSLKLTPEGYAALTSRMIENDSTKFILTEPTTAILRMHSLQLPRNQSFFEAGIQSDFSMGRLVGMDAKTKSKVFLHSIQGQFSSGNLSENVDFNFQAKGQSEQGSPTDGRIVGSLKHGFLPNGDINKQDLSLTLDGTIESLPIPLLCQFVCVDPKFRQKIEILLGSSINAKVKANLKHMNGPIFADVNGQNGRFIVDAQLDKGIMTLNQDLTAQIAVTQQLGEYVLVDFIPVLEGMISADHPINLTISKEGFALPLRDPSIKTIVFRQASLEMGKVRFSGDSQIAKVLSLLTPGTSDMLVWITPAYFSLNQGALKLARVDMLINDRYPIAAWGDVDMGKDRVNMIIALSGSAISKAFNVPGISNSYFLQLPLKGKLSNPSIDKTKAVARLSSLVAHSQGGPHGMVLGTVLDIATGGLTEPPPPAPTTNPLPWDHLMNDSSDSSDKNLNSNEQAKPNPIEEIGKSASSLLKKLFR